MAPPKKVEGENKGEQATFEAQNDTLRRISEQRSKEAETVNRCERIKLENDCHQFEKKHRLFSMHLVSERSSSQEALKDLVAHRHVLSAIANNNEQPEQQHNEKFGRYGEGAFKFALLPRIEEEKLRMEPMYRRQAMCKALLRQRRQMTVVQRSLTTEQVLTNWSRKQAPSPTRSLIIPPIRARRPLHITDSPRPAAARTASAAADMPAHGNQLASVFITQKAITKL